MLKLILFCLALLRIQVTVSQCLNRPPNIIFNTPETIETPLTAISLQQAYFETPNLLSPPLLPAPTTIITDCTPEVCKNLANTLQLMIVCNLLKNTKGGSDLAAQLAAPIISEFLSSPAFSCPCTERHFLNPVSPNLLTPGVSPVIPGLIGPGPMFPNAGVHNNALLGNYLSILSH